MPLPANYNTGVVQGTFMNMLGVPVAGSIIFTPNVTRLVDDAEDLVILPAQFIATLDIDGFFTITLPGTNDIDINPTDFTYTVTEDFVGTKGQTYSIPVPVGTTTDLSTVVHVEPTDGTAYIIGPEGPPGSPSGLSQTFTQVAPASVWGPFVYTLAFPPGGIMTLDTADTIVHGNIIHNTTTKEITVDFTPASFGGKLIVS